MESTTKRSSRSRSIAAVEEEAEEEERQHESVRIMRLIYDTNTSSDDEENMTICQCKGALVDEFTMMMI